MNPDTESVGEQEHTPVVCSPCSRDDAIETATQFCYECQEPMCETCAKYHRRNKATSRHQLTSVDEMKHDLLHPVSCSSEVLDTEVTCELHNYKKLKYVCRTDNQLCCSRCVIEKHRSCKDVLHVSEYTHLEEFNTQLKTNERNIDCLEHNAHILIAHEIQHVDYIRKVEQEEIEEGDVVRVQLIDEIQRAFDSRIKEIKSKAAGIVTRSETLQTNTKTILTEMETYATLHTHSKKYGNDAKKVITVREVANHISKLKKELIANYGKKSKETIAGELQVDEFLNKIVAVAQIKTGIPNKRRPKFVGIPMIATSMKVPANDKSSPPCMRECCVFDSGIVIATDESGSAISFFDANQSKVMGNYKLESEPWGIAKIEENKFAVSLPLKKQILCFVLKNKTLSNELTIQMESECSALTTYQENGKSVVAAYSRRTLMVYFVTLESNKKRKVGMGIQGRVLLSHINSIAADGEAGQLYLSCGKEHKVFACDFEGHFIWQVSHNIHTPLGLCVGINGEVNVCSYGTHEILQISGDGKLVSAFVDHVDLNGPVAIAYLEGTNKFVVCDHEPGNTRIKLFCIQGGENKRCHMNVWDGRMLVVCMWFPVRSIALVGFQM